MKRTVACCLFLAVLFCPISALAWDRSNDYEDFSASYAADGAVILRDMDLVEGSDTYSYSYDGVNWLPIEGAGPFPGGCSRMVPYNGRSFMILGSQFGLCCASEDGIHWRSLEETDWFQRSGVGRGDSDFCFRWTGSEYIMCQHIVDNGGMFGFGAAGPSPRNSVVCFLDEAFRLTGEYDFGSSVAEVGYAYGTYYAKTADDTGSVVYSSADRQTWLKTGLTAIPKETPAGIQVLLPHDCVSGGFLFGTLGGNVTVSSDGVSFRMLGRLPALSWPDATLTAVGAKAYVGRDGVIVLGAYTANGMIYSSSSAVVYPRSALSTALRGALPIYNPFHICTACAAF